MITYIDPSSVTGKRETATPVNYSRTGYGMKLPTSWMLQLHGRRWHRVYVICFSNIGSAYICTKAGNLFLGSYDPSYEPTF